MAVDYSNNGRTQTRRPDEGQEGFGEDRETRDVPVAAQEGWFEGVGNAVFGESAADRRERRENNEFRKIANPEGFGFGIGDGLNQQLQGQAGGNVLGANMQAQNGLIGQLQNQFAGNGPGQDIARMQAQQQADHGIQQQLALQAGNRGSGAALGAIGAANNSANITGNAGNQAMLGGLQAQLAAGQQLGSALGQQQKGLLGQQSGQLDAMKQQGLLAQMNQQSLIERQKSRGRRFDAIAGVGAGDASGGDAGGGLIGGALGAIFS